MRAFQSDPCLVPGRAKTRTLKWSGASWGLSSPGSQPASFARGDSARLNLGGSPGNPSGASETPECYSFGSNRPQNCRDRNYHRRGLVASIPWLDE